MVSSSVVAAATLALQTEADLFDVSLSAIL